MQVVLCPDECTHANDKEIPKAGDKGHHPDRDTEDYTRKKVFKRRKAVRVGLTFPDMRRVGAVLKFLKVSVESSHKHLLLLNAPKGV